MTEKQAKKILFYINTLGNGGAERAISNTASYFAEHGWDTILLTSFRLEGEYSYSNKVRRMSIENEQVIQSMLKRNISRIKEIRKICKKEQIDVVVSFMREPNFRALLATVGLQTKNIISVRSDPRAEYAGKIGKIISRYLLPCADGAVFQTQEAKSWFCQKLQQKSAVIYNLVDQCFYDTDYHGGQDIITCGRVIPVKNHTLLIKAFVKVHNQFPDVHLYIYGEKKESTGLKELIQKLKLENFVFMPGKCNDVPRVLAGAKLFVLSSNHEGMPNALMEAMAVGVPSVSTDCPCGGPRELFGGELSDMLVPVGNVEALADKMIELLSDDEKRMETGRKMKERAEEFRADKIGREWMEYVELACEK